MYNAHHCFDIDILKKAIHFILFETYVSFAGSIFHQVKGIPMGGNCSPLLADLFLSYCEFDYMTNLLRSKKYGLAKLLSNTSRYIDDICVINYLNFNEIIPKIYPPELLAERSGVDNKAVTYLDINLVVSDNGGVNTSIYHKVDEFPFEVVLLTFPQNCIPHSLGYNVFAGQVLRYGRICSNIEPFIARCGKTLTLLTTRGYNATRLKLKMQYMLHKHKYILYKFGLYSARQITDCLS